MWGEQEEIPLVFKLNDGGGPDLVRQVFLERGWVEYESETQKKHDWNIWWKSSRFRPIDFEELKPWQRMNHFPKATMLTKKDNLARNLRRMKGIYGSQVYAFCPLVYNLPTDYTRFVDEFTKRKQKGKSVDNNWICKPADLSRGRGIFVFNDVSQLQYEGCAVVQKYINNPLLISGYKFDLRIYVTITSFHPLNIYVHEEGIVRFSTQKFDLNKLDNVYSHLTNTSINKHSPSYSLDKELVGAGCKWTLTQLRHYFHNKSIEDRPMWNRIISIVILTIIVQAPQVPKVDKCFELYGFDVIIDETMKPWLLEVNFSPALEYDCPLDSVVKKTMIHDLMGLLNFKSEDIHHGKLQKKQRDIKRESISLRRPLISSRDRLPSIARSGLTARKNENMDDDDDDDDVSSDESIVALVPGCGLPSVQSQNRQTPRMSAGGSSGYSSASLSNRDYSVLSSRSGGEIRRNSSKSSLLSDSAVSGCSSEDLETRKIVPKFSKSIPESTKAKASFRNDNQITRSSILSSSRGFNLDVMPKKSPVQSRRPSLASLDTQGSTKPEMSVNGLGSLALQRRRSSFSYPRPPPGPVHNVGGYHLVFPFNDSTRKTANNLDAKVVIKEVQRLQKAVQNMVKGTSGETPDKICDTLLPKFWAPLMSYSEEKYNH